MQLLRSTVGFLIGMGAIGIGAGSAAAAYSLLETRTSLEKVVRNGEADPPAETKPQEEAKPGEKAEPEDAEIKEEAEPKEKIELEGAEKRVGANKKNPRLFIQQPSPRIEDPILNDPLRGPKVLEQWRVLAPHLSMKNELYLEDVTLATLTRALKNIAKLSKNSFDSHPDLQRVGPPMMRYLAESEGRIIPVFRANLNPEDVARDPENAMIGVFAEAVSRSAEAQKLRAWQLDYDEQVREAYSELLPLVRSMAAPATMESSLPEVSTPLENRPRLLVRNTVGQSLTDVTLVIDMCALDGRKARHYFYIDQWAAGADFVPRAAADWDGVGLVGTTHGTIEMLAKESSAPIAEFRLPPNVGWTVEHVLAPLIQTEPKQAMQRLQTARKYADTDKKVCARIDVLLAEARQTRAAMVASLRKKLNQIRDAKPQVKIMDRDQKDLPALIPNLNQPVKLTPEQQARVHEINKRIRELQ